MTTVTLEPSVYDAASALGKRNEYNHRECTAAHCNYAPNALDCPARRPSQKDQTLLTESLAEQVAPLILELDKLQESQLKADITAHFSTYTRKFSSLDNQKHQDRSARNQERRIEIQKQLSEAGYEYKPLQLPLEFYITPRYSKRELVATGTGKKREQVYDVSPSLKGIVELGREQSGCLHKVSAPTLQEGSDKALAGHLERCVKGKL